MNISDRLDWLLGAVRARPGISIHDLLAEVLPKVYGPRGKCRCGECMECTDSDEVNSGLSAAVEFDWLVISATGGVYETEKARKFVIGVCS